MKTAKPLLVSIAEASFQLSLSADEIDALIRDGELAALNVRGQILVEYQTLVSFTRRARRSRVRARVQESAEGR